MATRRTSGTRAKDSDRTATCQVLDSALAEGQLSLAEHEQRISSATHATTLGELQMLLADLQSTNPAQLPPVQARDHRVVLAAIVGVLMVCVAAVAWLVSRPDSPSAASTPEAGAEAPATHVLAADPSTTTPAAPEDPSPVVLAPPQDLQSADGLARVIDEMRKRFGDTMGYELAVMRDQAILARPDPTDEGSKLIYTFRGGWGDPSSRSRSDTDDLTDLAAFDIPAAAAALQAAPETLRIAPADVSDTDVDVDYIADEGGSGVLELLVKVTTTSGANGFVYLDAASNVKRVEYPG